MRIPLWRVTVHQGCRSKMLSSTQCGQSAGQSHVHLEPQSLRLALCGTGTRIPTTMQALRAVDLARDACLVLINPSCTPRTHPPVFMFTEVGWTRGSTSCVLLRTERQPWVPHATLGHRGRVRIQYFCVSVTLIMLFRSSRKNWASLLKWTWGQILTQPQTPLIRYMILSKLLLRSLWTSVSSPVRQIAGNRAVSDKTPKLRGSINVCFLLNYKTVRFIQGLVQLLRELFPWS